jgi:hypothetical protein
MHTTRKWLGPFAGIISAVTIFVGPSTGSLDTVPSDSARSVLADLREHSDDLETGALLTMVGVAMLLVFLGHLRHRLREGGAATASSLVGLPPRRCRSGSAGSRSSSPSVRWLRGWESSSSCSGCSL